ncbi:Serine/threonine-protein phosphatase 2A 65 kDa regulatory subunit A gamma isoform [Dictyocoela muelleri]|nr:Serine/threonine-protein phosphatase 2A 65 kDa regulatory subunit A gamma isoform [Dictyocoela muelleri]
MQNIKTLKEQVGIKPPYQIIELIKEFNFTEIEEHILLLILDNYEISLEYLKSIRMNIPLSFIEKLKTSIFYTHRLVAANLTDDKNILFELINDKVGVVAKAALMNIKLNDKEAEMLAKKILSEGSIYLQCGVVFLISKIEDRNIILEIIDIIKCKSWRVRLCLVSNIRLFNIQKDIYLKFINDPDENIRIALASQIQIKNFGFLNDIEMLNDEDENVRLTCVQMIIDKYKGVEKSNNRRFGDASILVFDKCNSNENQYGLNVRNNIYEDDNDIYKDQYRDNKNNNDNYKIKNDESENGKNIIPEEFIYKIMNDPSQKIKLEALRLDNKDLSMRIIPLFLNNENWRIRKQILESIYRLKHVGLIDFDSDLWEYFKMYFYDTVSEMRQLTANMFLELCKEFGESWTQSKILFLEELANSKSYFTRLTVVPICISLKIKDILIKLLKDRVSNVVLNVLLGLNDIWDSEVLSSVGDLSVSSYDDLRDAAVNLINRSKFIK